jgi:hypothetical protein
MNAIYREKRDYFCVTREKICEKLEYGRSQVICLVAGEENVESMKIQSSPFPRWGNLEQVIGNLV